MPSPNRLRIRPRSLLRSHPWAVLLPPSMSSVIFGSLSESQLNWQLHSPLYIIIGQKQASNPSSVNNTLYHLHRVQRSAFPWQCISQSSNHCFVRVFLQFFPSSTTTSRYEVSVRNRITLPSFFLYLTAHYMSVCQLLCCAISVSGSAA